MVGNESARPVGWITQSGPRALPLFLFKKCHLDGKNRTQCGMPLAGTVLV